jgi:5-formyltetrahydrofolate cyclo-ligase
MSTKQALREMVLTARDSLSASQRAADSSLACARVLSALRARHAALLAPRPLTVASFMSFRTELDTACLNAALLREPQLFVLALPRVERELRFYAVQSLSESSLQRSRFGILEPRADANALVASTDIDVFVTPGVAFDARGGRLGYGRGLYDRLCNPRSKVIGLAFDVQIVASVPTEPHDVAVGLVVTPTRTIEVGEDHQRQIE